MVASRTKLSNPVNPLLNLTITVGCCTIPQVEGEGLPAGCKAHKGMVQAARIVLTRLNETRALAEACASRPGYGLVITGEWIWFILIVGWLASL